MPLTEYLLQPTIIELVADQRLKLGDRSFSMMTFSDILVIGIFRVSAYESKQRVILSIA